MTKELASKIKKEEANKEKLEARKKAALEKIDEQRTATLEKIEAQRQEATAKFKEKYDAAQADWNAQIAASNEHLKELNAIRTRQEKLEAQWASLNEEVDAA